MIVILFVLVAAGAWLIWVQQQAMKRFDVAAKSIENQLKAVDLANQQNRAVIDAQIKLAADIRKESRKAQETAHQELVQLERIELCSKEHL